MQPADGAFDVLVVASWFPAYDDPAAGRFVADQAEALLATGIARPAVISFDGIRLTGGAATRGRQAEVVLEATRTAAREMSPFFVEGEFSPGSRLPIARLSIPDGQTPAAGVAHAAQHRRAALDAAADRLRAAGSTGIVHAHTVYPDGAAAADLAERLGWPLIITEHSSFVDRVIATPALRQQYAAALSRAFRTFAVGEMLANELRAAFPEHAATIQVMPNAVPMDLFVARPLADRIPDELLFVGYRKPSKGIENLLRAVAAARELRPSITLRLLGRSPDAATENRWQVLAAELGLADAVTFDDPIDRAGVAAAMARASLFVHPSPRETFGVVAVEALASGLPVVATDSGGVSEILGPEPGRLGALVPIDDPAALGTAIVESLERRASFDPDELRSSVERRFGSAYVAERLLVAYREALVGSRPPASDGWSPLTGVVWFRREILIVALDRERAALRLGSLPEELRQRLYLVTATEPAGQAIPAFRDIMEVTVAQDSRAPARANSPTTRRGWQGRLARLAADPVGTLKRRLGRGTGSEGSLAPATRAIRENLGRFTAQVEVLPLDGSDYLAVAPLVRDGTARLAHGGVRRQADMWNTPITDIPDEP